jgi:hypothetical protein
MESCCDTGCFDGAAAVSAKAAAGDKQYSTNTAVRPMIPGSLEGGAEKYFRGQVNVMVCVPVNGSQVRAADADYCANVKRVKVVPSAIFGGRFILSERAIE